MKGFQGASYLCLFAAHTFPALRLQLVPHNNTFLQGERKICHYWKPWWCSGISNCWNIHAALTALIHLLLFVVAHRRYIRDVFDKKNKFSQKCNYHHCCQLHVGLTPNNIRWRHWLYKEMAAASTGKNKASTEVPKTWMKLFGCRKAKNGCLCGKER